MPRALGGRGFLVLALALATAVLAAAAGARAGGIADVPCPTVAGEYTNTCPSGTVGVPYEIRFVESEGSGCGPGRQTFHLDSGVAPPGLTLASNGTLSGTPLAAGRFRFYVEMREPVNDPQYCTGERTQKQFTLWVRNPLSVVSQPGLVLRGEVGLSFENALRAQGGTGVYAWTLAEGVLPAGLTLGRRGTIAGTPRTSGTFGFATTVRDTEKRSASWAGTMQVAAQLRIRTERLPAARVGRSYGAAVRTSGGVGRRTWTLARGRLPRGLRLDRSRGLVSGTPREAGIYRGALRVRDELGARRTANLVLVVHAPSRPLLLRGTRLVR